MTLLWLLVVATVLSPVVAALMTRGVRRSEDANLRARTAEEEP